MLEGFPLRLYDSPVSGNCYKVRLLLAQLGLDYQLVPVDVLQRDARPAQLLQESPTGRVPLLVLPDGRTLAESNAILCYLAEGTERFPADPFARSKVLQWLFFEQNQHEPNIAVARYWVSIARVAERYAEPLELRRRAGYQALEAMEQRLDRRDFMTGAYTIADIALYAYTHVAEEGGFDLARFPAIRAWLRRVEAQPGWVPMLGDR